MVSQYQKVSVAASGEDRRGIAFCRRLPVSLLFSFLQPYPFLRPSVVRLLLFP
jgi:hypothetical protein